MTPKNTGHVVEDGRLRFISASQLEKHDEKAEGGCRRKWWFRYVARKKEPMRGSLVLGVQCHSQLEHYLKTGEDVLGDVVRPGLRFLPKPGKDLLVELEFGAPQWPGPVPSEIESPLMAGGVPLIGSADLMHFREEYVDDDGVLHDEPGTAEVLDHKTSKQIDDELDDGGKVKKKGWAKTAEQLVKTWQMLGYGELAYQRFKTIERVRLGHAVYQTTGRRRAVKRSLSLPIADVRRGWSKADQLVEEMRATARAKRVEDVAPNYDACGAYGGCPHRAICPRDPKVVLAGIFGRAGAASLLARGGHKEEKPTMSILAKRKAERAAAEAAAAKGKKATSPEVGDEIEELEEEERAAKAGIEPPDRPKSKKTHEDIPEGSSVKVPAKKKKAPISGDCAECGEELTDDNASTLQNGDVKHVGCEGAPVDGQCEVSGQVELTTDEAIEKKRTCACGAEHKVKPQKMDGAWYALVPEHEAPKKAAPPKAKKAEPSVKVFVEDGEGGRTELTGDDVDEAVVERADKAAKGKPKQTTLALGAAPTTFAISSVIYLDAVVDGFALPRLEAYAEKLAADLADEYKAADVRCAPADSPLGFGKWKGALAALVRATPPAHGSYAVSSGSEVGMVAFEALASSSDWTVVRGVK